MGRGDSGGASSAHASSMVKWKVDPSPTLDSTHVVPPISSVSRLLITSPSPAHPRHRTLSDSFPSANNSRAVNRFKGISTSRQAPDTALQAGPLHARRKLQFLRLDTL